MITAPSPWFTEPVPGSCSSLGSRQDLARWLFSACPWKGCHLCSVSAVLLVPKLPLICTQVVGWACTMATDPPQQQLPAKHFWKLILPYTRNEEGCASASASVGLSRHVDLLWEWHRLLQGCSRSGFQYSSVDISQLWTPVWPSFPMGCTQPHNKDGLWCARVLQCRKNQLLRGAYMGWP